MNREDALELVEFAKGLFRYMTPPQGAALRDLIIPFPEPNFVREQLKTMATQKPVGEEDRWQEGNISLAAIRERIASELRRRGITTYDTNRRTQRRAEKQAVENWTRIDGMIADMSDADLDELKPQALMLLDNQKARDMFDKRTVRDSKTLRWLVYKVLTERGVA